METKDILKVLNRASKPVTELNHDKECVICYQDGIMRELHLHSSFIKEFYYKGNARDICPVNKRQILIEKIYKDERKECSDAIKYGLFFEQNTLGKSARDEEIIVLPRHAKTNKMLSPEIRIRQQIALFPMLCEQYGIKVTEKNVQVVKIGHINCPNHPGIDVFIHCTADFISSVKINNYEKEEVVIDLKMTGDINSTFGEFGWGNMQYIDKFQGVLYSMVFQLPFAYWIFDHKKDIDNKFEPINTNVNHPDPVKANEAKTRIFEVKQTIYDMVDDLVKWENEYWPYNPTKENCDHCQNIYCEHKNKILES